MSHNVVDKVDIAYVIPTVFASILLYYWYHRPKNSPPGPRGIPFFGILLFLGKWGERKLTKWSKIYGPIMMARMGRFNALILNDYDSINQALVKQQSTFSGRPEVDFLDRLKERGGIVFRDYGPLWKSQRKFGFMTLRGFGVGNKSMENRVIEELSYLNEAIQSHKGKAFNISDILRKAISNNICSVIFGKRYGYDDKKFAKLLHIMLQTFEDPAINNMIRVLFMAPLLIHLPPISITFRTFKKNTQFVLASLQAIVDEHEETYDKENLRDFIDVFLKEMKEGNDKYFTNHQLLVYIEELINAGSETTSSTLNWALICLLHYPQVQKKLRKEIMQVVGSDGSVNMFHKPNMPYTNAFIQELYRFRTLVPLSLFHKTTDDTMLNGYFIPKNTMVVPNIWAVHNDSKTWVEPEVFKPERFIDEKGNFVSSKHVIPFSVGLRRCLGEQMARMEVFLFLVSMVQKFEFLPDPEAYQLPSIDDGSNGTAFVPYPYKIVAREL